MQIIRKGESMRDERVEGVIVAIFIILVLLAAWLTPIVFLSHKIDELKNDKQEVIVKVEYIHPQEPSEDALEISTNY